MSTHSETQDGRLTPLDVAQDLAAFVSDSPSSYHAAASIAKRLSNAGFTPLAEATGFDVPPGGRHFVVRDGAVVAFVVPSTLPAAPSFRVVGSHTDSPAFKLGPRADYVAEGAHQVDVEIYGGPLLNSWLDRELRFAGQLTLADGSRVLAETGAVARIPQLAIHLDRAVNEGLTLDKQRHVQPVLGLDMPGSASVFDLLAQSAGVDAGDIRGHDVYTIAAQPPAVFGAAGEFLASPRLDNLSAVHASTQALIDVAPEALDAIAVLAAFDHEEVGSATRSGACGPFLSDVLERVGLALGASRADVLAGFASSVCVSADAGHAAHPNYPERHDPLIRPRLGGGPLLKLNAQQRYASDAVGTVVWAQACERAGVEYQEFVSNNTMPCGSTIGPLTATRLGMVTVDVGLPLWSMHSAREMCAIDDLVALRGALGAFLQG